MLEGSSVTDYPPPTTPPYGEQYNEPPTPAVGTYFDEATGLTLPVGTTLATNGRRIGAYFLAIPLYIVTLVIGYWIWGLLAWTRGTSPALMALQMKVYNLETGEVANFGRMSLRNIVYVSYVLFIPALVSFVLFLSTDKRKALHDYAANTVVLFDPNRVLG